MKVFLNKMLPKVIGYSLNGICLLSKQKAGDLALQIFCKPRTGQIRPKDATFLDTSVATQMIKHAQGQVKAYIWNPLGEETILLLHGWESNAARWRFLIPKLIAANFKVVAIDAPAHGASSGNQFDLLKYTDALKAADEVFKPTYVIGHSMGGAGLCFYYHINGSNLFKKIVLLGVPSELSAMVGEYARVIGLSNRTVRAFNMRFYEQYNLKVETISAAAFCQKIETPTLVIHDEGDLTAQVEDSILYDRNLIRSELMLTNGLGHSLQDEKVYDRIVNYFK